MGRAGELHQAQQLIDARVRNIHRASKHPQMVTTSATGVKIGRLEHRTDPQGWTRQLRVGMIEHQCPSTRRRYQPEDHPQRRRLTGPVWPKKARDRPRFQDERQIRDRRDLTRTAWVSDSASTTAVTCGPLSGQIEEARMRARAEPLGCSRREPPAALPQDLVVGE